MTDETPSAPAAPSTPATPAAPAAAATPPAAPAAPASPQAPPAAADTPAAFKIRDEYKDKPWASKIKSEEDLYKQVDNLTGLVGKKVVNAADLAGKSTEEVEAFFQSLRPSDKAAYKFGEEGTFDQKFTGSVADMLYDSGISEHQANKLIPAYQKLEMERLKDATSADGFKETMKENFGDKYDAIVANASKNFKEHLSEKNQKLLDVIPNGYLPVIYELAQKHTAQIEALKTQYGVKENGDAHLAKGGNLTDIRTVAEKRAPLVKQLNEIKARAHTQKEVDDKINEIQSLYNK